MKLRVSLNGTATNPYERYGLTQNPFPQIATYELTPMCLHLQKLGAAPIKNVDQIREHLKGWSTEFVELCCARYEPDKITTFVIEFDPRKPAASYT